MRDVRSKVGGWPLATAIVDSLKALDPKWPIREADAGQRLPVGVADDEQRRPSFGSGSSTDQGGSRDESGVGVGITTGKQSDIAAQTHQFFGKPGDHPFCSAVQLRGYALCQGCYFRDAHSSLTVARSQPKV
jgi:hypothetical protein